MNAANRKLLKEIFEWLKDILIALGVTLFITTFIYQNTQVIGDSMEPTLQDGNAIIVNKFIYRFQQPKRGDIIAFKYSQNPSQHFIKRIIAIEGDKIDIRDGKVYLNDQVLEENYILEPMDTIKIGNMHFPIVIPKDSYFVMGDNRNVSFDSRYTEVGLIPLSYISGKAVLRIWPFNMIGLIK
ncbi:MAG: signal peptidase [Epulopiscium sp.]|uniref:Signal peptidase I n=1 Tax=Defluviitalea raffinosedens TaxID=1450156 RepID=A0A7C8HGF2_9FIRM|nr:signal peptidase I [Defluviitalea raffinosedens]MBZ4669298.1 signal peptidase [Defluviitaleaceae bacterium]MDK2788589.1 signal peptidase [Candidatus Epulonipiscium sp.]KAE9637170.1 signal peptidase I [Defluviitalea raffinosedens]MBM7686526.1 signal peptidase I [Defluviitalea raffinosedens]HHW66803.1 signal peptidase I [Candidatus Epulonipiscium sp.]